MSADNHPLQLLLLTVCGWVNQHQQDVVAYLVEENRVLKEQVRGSKLPIVRAVTEFIEHYHAERPHQGIGNEWSSGAKSWRTVRSSAASASAEFSRATG